MTQKTECIPGTDVPRPTVRLGECRDAVDVMVAVSKEIRRAMRRAGKYPWEAQRVVVAYCSESAEAQDQERTLQTAMKYVDCK